MDLTKLSMGRNPPWDFNALIEVPVGGVPVKYEFDKSSGFMVVDRFLHTSMHYPGNYGFIPHTLAADGDPMDVLIYGPVPVVPGAVVRCRPIGALIMEDEAGGAADNAAGSASISMSRSSVRCSALPDE